MVGFIETVSSLTSRCHRRHVTLVFNLLRLAPPTVRGGPVQPTKCTHQKCNHEVTKTRSTHEECTQRLSSWFRVFVAKNAATRKDVEVRVLGSKLSLSRRVLDYPYAHG